MIIKVFGVDKLEENDEMKSGHFGDPGVERRIGLCVETE